MLNIIGFDRYVDLKWLDGVPDLLSSSSPQINSEGIRNYMNEMLKQEYLTYESRRKIITVLMRTWVKVPEKHRQLHQNAIRLFKIVQPQDRIWIHWGMILLAYPFFRDVASTIGRLTLLQGEVTSSQIHRRIEEKWGQRSTLIRAIDRVLQTMNSWKVIQSENSKNTHNASTFSTDNKQLQLWLIGTVLISEAAGAMQLQAIFKSPSIFPFNLGLSRYDLQNATNFCYSRESLDSEIVSLKE